MEFKIDRKKLECCRQCHVELGFYVVRLDDGTLEQFCSQDCAQSWEYYEDQHPFFEPEIL